MKKNIPTFKVLSAFEAVALTGSFSRAAEMLGITHSAISQSIKSLELLCGSSLIDRTTHKVSLSEIGMTYYSEISNALNRIRKATEQLQNGKFTLTVNMPTSFAVSWFNIRLEDFFDEHSGFDLKVSMLRRNIKYVDFKAFNIDISIEYGKIDDWSSCTCEKIIPGSLILAGNRDIILETDHRSLIDLIKKQKIIIVSQNSRKDDCQTFCNAAGIKMPDVKNHIYYTSTAQALNASIRGEGILITQKLLVQDSLNTGSLIQLSKIEAVCNESYFIVHPENSKNSFAIKILKDWLKHKLQIG